MVSWKKLNANPKEITMSLIYYVYLSKAIITPLMFTRKGELIKIGFSTCPEIRTPDISKGTFFDCQLIKTIKFPSKHGARYIETGLHNSLADYHIRREWFYVGFSLFDKLCLYFSNFFDQDFELELNLIPNPRLAEALKRAEFLKQRKKILDSRNLIQ